jgi:hypothetical protein
MPEGIVINRRELNRMNTPANKFDSIEQLIYDEDLRIETVDIHPELDLLLVILNTKAVLRQRLSSYERLKTGNPSALLQYELIGGGTGIHWPLLDEDLSLKGFLRDELRNVVNNNKPVAA